MTQDNKSAETSSTNSSSATAAALATTSGITENNYEAGKHFRPLIGGVEQATVAATGRNYNSHNVFLNHLFQLRRFHSVADFGCGAGYWLAAAKNMGIKSIQGFDAYELKPEEYRIDRSEVEICDLSKPLNQNRKFDLAISTEVAEHIPAKFAETFVDNICNASNMVLFSAAIPYQQGAHHINENWVEYWFEMFRKNDFFCLDIFRKKFWNDARIVYYYRQNSLLYVSRDLVPHFSTRGVHPTFDPISIVHPEMLIQAVNRSLEPDMRYFERDAKMYYEVVHRKNIKWSSDRHTYGQEKLWRTD